MIPRYKRKEISKIWEPENKFNIWLKIELLICEALSNRGDIPKDSFKTIKKNARFDIDRIDVIEKDVKHDVIAFLTNIGENIGHDSRFVHMGVTSSDIIDTAFSIQLKQSCSILKKELKKLSNNLKVKSLNFKNTACIGRSHGIFAEPTTFGLKMLGKYCEFERHYKRLCDAEKQISICSISGAVGTYANIDPSIESFVAKKLKLKTEDVSTQIIPRDRHAFFFTALAMIASSIENLAIEFRHLHRSEVREVEEFFSKDQKGSSAMPHKKNPVLSENLTGIARVIRSSCIPFMENISLWHERDISHSSVERTLGPDTIILCDFALSRMNNIVEKITYSEGAYWGDPEKMRFRTSIDSFADATEVTDAERLVRTTFTVTMRGYLLPEGNFDHRATTQKFLSPKKVLFSTETDNVIDKRVGTSGQFRDELDDSTTSIPGGRPAEDIRVTTTNTLTLSQGTGVTLTPNNLSFDGSVALNQIVAIGQDVSKTSDVVFNSISASSFSAGNTTINDGVITSTNLGLSGSLTTTGTFTVNGNATILGTVTAQEIKTEFISASILFTSGSTKFGDDTGDVHNFTGSLQTTGSFTLNSYSVNEISNDTTLSDNSATALVTERAAKTFIDNETTTQQSYLRKQFVKTTASITAPSTASFTAVTA